MENGSEAVDVGGEERSTNEKKLRRGVGEQLGWMDGGGSTAFGGWVGAIRKLAARESEPSGP